MQTSMFEDKKDMENTIYTMGHSNKTIEQFIELAKKFNISTLVDVRSIPYSKYNPQFNKQDFNNSLSNAGIKYEWRGKNLGGLEGNVYMDEALDEYTKRAKTGERIAVCCSEGNPDQCHRSWTLAPAFINRGLVVQHILWDGTLKKHFEKPDLFSSLQN